MAHAAPSHTYTNSHYGSHSPPSPPPPGPAPPAPV